MLTSQTENLLTPHAKNNDFRKRLTGEGLIGYSQGGTYCDDEKQVTVPLETFKVRGS